MGTSNTVAQFVAKIENAAKELEKARIQAVREAAQVAKKRVEASRDRVAPSGRLRNVGKSGGKLSVNYQITGDTASITARGPWPIIESDIGRHVIGAKGKRARSGRAGIRFPDGGIRRTVVHPGTKGKHPFRKGVDDAVKPVTDVIQKISVNAVRGVFT